MGVGFFMDLIDDSVFVGVVFFGVGFGEVEEFFVMVFLVGDVVVIGLLSDGCLKLGLGEVIDGLIVGSFEVLRLKFEG